MIDRLSAARQRLPAILLAAVLGASPVAAGPERGVLDEVRTMLEAGMSEPIIVRWLDGNDRRPRHPSAADLIALKEAGASDELLTRVLELAGEAPDAMPESAEPPAAARPEPPPAADAPRAATTAAPATAPPPVTATPPAAPPARTALPAAAPTANTAGEVPVYFELSYLPDFDEDEDEWRLYLYVDGEPLTYVPAGSLLSSKPLRFRQFLAPGSHTLRVAQERHVKRGRDRWFHAARMASLELPLALAAGERADVELKFRQPRLAFGSSEGPLSYRLVQGETVAVIEKQGGDPEDWAVVCEELEANAEDSRELKKSLRRQLDDCTPWAALWTGREVPSRDEVREALALFRYRPISKDRPLD